MSTAKFNTWVNPDGTENYKCRAWVNFNGTGTVAIRASGNVSSITDNGTGDYTVNFTTAMPDANYTAAACLGGNDVAGLPTAARQATNNTTSFRYTSTFASGSSAGVFDYAMQMISFFR
jgi:hypothetical protein